MRGWWGLALVACLAACGSARPGGADASTWLPRVVAGQEVQYRSGSAVQLENGTLIGASAFSRAGIDPRTIRQTTGTMGDGNLLIALSARGVAPERLVQVVIEEAAVPVRGHGSRIVAGRTVTVLDLPAYSATDGSLVLVDDTLVWLMVREELLAGIVEQLPD